MTQNLAKRVQARLQGLSKKFNNRDVRHLDNYIDGASSGELADFRIVNGSVEPPLTQVKLKEGTDTFDLGNVTYSGTEVHHVRFQIGNGKARILKSARLPGDVNDLRTIPLAKAVMEDVRTWWIEFYTALVHRRDHINGVRGFAHSLVQQKTRDVVTTHVEEELDRSAGPEYGLPLNASGSAQSTAKENCEPSSRKRPAEETAWLSSKRARQSIESKQTPFAGGHACDSSATALKASKFDQIMSIIRPGSVDLEEAARYFLTIYDVVGSEFACMHDAATRLRDALKKIDKANKSLSPLKQQLAAAACPSIQASTESTMTLKDSTAGTATLSAVGADGAGTIAENEVTKQFFTLTTPIKVPSNYAKLLTPDSTKVPSRSNKNKAISVTRPAIAGKASPTPAPRGRVMKQGKRIIPIVFETSDEDEDLIPRSKNKPTPGVDNAPAFRQSPSKSSSSLEVYAPSVEDGGRAPVAAAILGQKGDVNFPKGVDADLASLPENIFTSSNSATRGDITTEHEIITELGTVQSTSGNSNVDKSIRYSSTIDSDSSANPRDLSIHSTLDQPKTSAGNVSGTSRDPNDNGFPLTFWDFSEGETQVSDLPHPQMYGTHIPGLNLSQDGYSISGLAMGGGHAQGDEFFSQNDSQGYLHGSAAGDLSSSHNADTAPVFDDTPQATSYSVDENLRLARLPFSLSPFQLDVPNSAMSDELLPGPSNTPPFPVINPSVLHQSRPTTASEPRTSGPFARVAEQLIYKTPDQASPDNAYGRNPFIHHNSDPKTISAMVQQFETEFARPGSTLQQSHRHPAEFSLARGRASGRHRRPINALDMQRRIMGGESDEDEKVVDEDGTEEGVDGS